MSIAVVAGRPDLTSLAAAGPLQVSIAVAIPRTHVADAHRRPAEGGLTGPIILRP